MGETIVVSVLTRDEFVNIPVFNFLSFTPSNGSIFAVSLVVVDEISGTAQVTLTGLAPGVAKLLQASAAPDNHSIPQTTTPTEILTVTVLDASRFVFQVAETLTHTTISFPTLSFDESIGRLTIMGEQTEQPLVSVSAVPVDVRHAFEVAETRYGVSSITWSCSHAGVLFIASGGDYDSGTPTLTGALSVDMRILNSVYRSFGGEETVTITATNARQEIITGTLLVRVLLASTVEAQ